MAAPARLSPAEYFALDEASLETKHELVDGVPYAMAGGSPTHARLCAALAAVLFNQLRGTPCVPYSSDFRIQIDSKNYAFPDQSIICGAVETDPQNSHTGTNPIAIFEVLSPSTANYDLGRKSELYRRMPSLQVLVFVEQHAPAIETLTRQDDDSWLIRRYEGLDKVVPLNAVPATITLAELYDGIEFPAAD